MNRLTLLGFAATSLALVIATAAGCGGDEASRAPLRRDVLATVGHEEIPRAVFERRWTRIQGSPTQTPASRSLARSALIDEIIQAEWLRQELGRRGIDIGARDVGLGGLTDQLVNAVVPPATARDISAYYDANHDRYVQRERRDLWLIVTTTKRAANAARAEIRKGRDWPGTARKYSVDDLSLGHTPAGSMAVLQTEFDDPLDAELFKAREGALKGPLKSYGGWYLFKVRSIAPGRQLPLPAVRQAIVDDLRSQRPKRIAKALADTKSRYRPQTRCAAAFVTSSCGNWSGGS